MPYDSTKELPEQVKKLPANAKRIFLKAFNASFAKYGEQASFQIAWGAVKKMFSKKNDVWVRKSSVSVKSVVARSGIFGTRYFFDAVIASNELADDGYIATDGLLESIVKTRRIDNYGDADHNKLSGNYRLNKLFGLTNYQYLDGKLYGKFFVDKTHPQYKWFIENYKNREIQLSAEFYNPKIKENKIVDCEKLGWSVVLDTIPVDKNAVAI